MAGRLITYFQAEQMEREGVQAIIGKRYNTQKRTLEYKVLWLNYPASEATWEERDNLAHAQDMLNEFDSRGFPITNAARDSLQDNQLSANSPFYPQVSEPVPIKRGRGRPPKKQRKVNDIKFSSSLEKSLSVRHACKTQENRPAPSQVETKRKRGRPKKIKPQPEEESEELSPERKQFLESAEGNLPERSGFDADSEFFVLDLRKNGEKAEFLVQDHRMESWMSREELVRCHPVALVEFYERHLQINELELQEEPSRYPKRLRR